MSRSGNCALCGIWRRSLHRDHIVPKFKGGSNDHTNIQLICANCHEDKTRDDLIGWPMSPAARRAQAIAQTGKQISESRRAAITATNRVVCRTPEFREKMRAAAYARENVPQAPEQRFHCGDCDMITHAGPMTRHQNATGHTGRRLEGTLF